MRRSRQPRPRPLLNHQVVVGCFGGPYDNTEYVFPNAKQVKASINVAAPVLCAGYFGQQQLGQYLLTPVEGDYNYYRWVQAPAEDRRAESEPGPECSEPDKPWETQ